MLRFIFVVTCLLFAGYGYGKEYTVIVVEGAVASLQPGAEKPDKAATLNSGDQVRIVKAQKLINLGNNTKLYVIAPMSKRLWLNLKPYQHIAFSDIEKQMKTSRFEVFSAAISKFFLYETESFQGGKRLDDKQTLAGFPFGTVLMPESSLVVRLKRDTGEQYSDFSLFSERNSSPLLRVNQVNDQITIPINYLANGEDYRWQINKNGRTYSGYFKMAHQVDQVSYEKEVHELPHYETLSPEGKLLIKAMKLKEWQFSYDMDISAKALLVHSQTSNATVAIEGELE